ncbi:MAG: HAD family phosphatase [Ferruginibacter sp.]
MIARGCIREFRLTFAFFKFMKAIKNVIFDLGGVILNIDYQKTARAFNELGVHQFDELYSQSTANHLFEALETGDISEESFFESMQPYCREGTTQEQIQAAWNAILLDFRNESLQVLESLKGKYNLFLLSNTNSIHHTAFNRILLEDTGKRSLDVYFTKSYYSHLIRMRKPYAATYQWVLNDGNMVAGETLFVDDSIININGADEVGIKTHLLLPTEKLADLGL